VSSFWGRRISVRIGQLKVGLSLRRFLVVLLSLVVLFGFFLVFGTSVFGVRRVSVEGVHLITVGQVRERASISEGTPLARLDTAAVADRIGQIPEVARVEVFRAWPHSVRIVVTERKAVAVTKVRGGWRLVDSSGVAFRTVAERPALPQVELAHLGPKDRVSAAALEVAQALTPELLAKLDKVTAKTPAQVTLHLLDHRTIFWGDSTENARKARAATAILSRPGKEIDVSAPDVVTVR
jgi:cell division protein FtsQ